MMEDCSMAVVPYKPGGRSPQEGSDTRGDMTLSPIMPTAWHHMEKERREKIEKRRRRIFMVVLPLLVLIVVVVAVVAWKVTRDYYHHQDSETAAMAVGAVNTSVMKAPAITRMPTTTESTTTTTVAPTIPSCPTPCSCQQHKGHITNIIVDCSGQNLTEIPIEYIPHNTTALNMADNKLTKIDHTLTAYSDLEELNLGNNQIEDIDGDAIAKINLKWLNLRGNNLQEIPSQTFSLQAECDLQNHALDSYTHVKGGRWEVLDLENIDWPCLIDLRDNPISKIGFRAFSGSSNFSLFLGHSDVKLTIDSSAFDDTKNMIGLHITNLHQLDLAPGSFDGMDNIAWIVIDKVQNLDLCNRLFRTATNSRPQWLRVSNSNVTALSSDVLSVTMDVKTQCFVKTYPVNKILTNSMSEIDSGGIEFLNNTLPVLPTNLIKGAHIGGIYFYGNDIAGFKEGVFTRSTHNSSICVVKFNGNKFNVIPTRAFKNLRNVVHVSFSERNLTSIETLAFQDSSNIGSLRIILHDNKAIDEVTIRTRAFTAMTEVQIFELSRVGSSDRGVHKPKFVIEKFAFAGLSVDYFALNLHRFIREISDNLFSALTVRERLALNAHGLKRIHPKAFGLPGDPMKTSIKRLDVSGIQNIACDCESGKLVANLEAQNIKVFGLFCTGKQHDGTLSHNLHLDHGTCAAVVQHVSLSLVFVITLIHAVFGIGG